MAENNNIQDVSNFGDSLLDIWTNSLDRVYASRKEIENLLLQAFATQKESWEKLTGDLNRIEEEQKKLVEELREYVKQNIQKIYGEQASQSFEQWNAQFDEVSSRIQQLTVTPYKESLNLLNQSQEHFQQSIKNGIDQQQKIREDALNQMKTTQKVFIDLFQSNTKLAMSLYK